MAFNLAYNKYFKDFRIFLYRKRDNFNYTYKEVNLCKKVFVKTYTYAIYNII